jgi:RNA polymerase sigma factor (sigma-70 family)
MAGLSEQELLHRFVERRDPRAFEAVVQRHGPLVLAVCRQLLVDPNDIDDAFQAAFLVFIRKAASIRKPGSLANWLYGVAYRTASRLKRRSRPIRLLTDRAGRSVSCPIDELESISLLHHEIDRLPDKYRQPIVLCYLEGLTHDAAATRLNWPVGTVRGRLARARDRLRDQLERRGVSHDGVLAAALERSRLTSAVLTESTFRSTRTLLELAVSLRVASIAQGVVSHMFINKLKWTALALTVSGLVLVAAGTGLRAIAKQNESKVEAYNIRRDQDLPKQSDFGKVIKKALTRAEGAAAEKTVTDANEELADRLEQHKVEAELLEIKTQALKAALQRDIQFSSQLEYDGGMGGGGTPEERERMEEERRKMMANHERRLQNMFHEFTDGRLKLARLQRQIAREAKALNQPAPDAGPSSLNRRIDSLEAKLDQVLEMLSKAH